MTARSRRPRSARPSPRAPRASRPRGRGAPCGPDGRDPPRRHGSPRPPPRRRSRGTSSRRGRPVPRVCPPPSGPRRRGRSGVRAPPRRGASTPARDEVSSGLPRDVPARVPARRLGPILSIPSSRRGGYARGTVVVGARARPCRKEHTMRRSIVNDPEDLVPEALEGLVLSNPLLLDLDEEHRVVTRRQPARDRVGLVSGGGSGHEPLHAGFVGTGMLDVAVAGAVFASPTALQVLEATKAADAGRGVVQIVKNYTGDVLNFRIAGEISGDDAVETEIVLVDDDLATDTGDGGGPGRRGTAATVIVEKLCGAAAEAGADLAEVAAIGRRAASRARTMSLALSAGTHPGDAEPQFTLDDDEVELGVGIHGERGRDRVP